MASNGRTCCQPPWIIRKKKSEIFSLKKINEKSGQTGNISFLVAETTAVVIFGGLLIAVVVEPRTVMDIYSHHVNR